VSTSDVHGANGQLAGGHEPATPTIQAPPGWYPDPTMAANRRYWDGTAWTPHVASADVPPAATPPPGGRRSAGDGAASPNTDTAFAWTLATLPLACIPVDYFVPEAAASSVTILAFWAFSGALAKADAQRLKHRDITTSWGWVLLFPPIYLIQRTRRAKSTAFIPILWATAFVAYMIAAFSFNATFPFDGESQASYIES
jgi:hypothetical protein